MIQRGDGGPESGYVQGTELGLRQTLFIIELFLLILK
jgi:hypothetical protein